VFQEKPAFGRYAAFFKSGRQGGPMRIFKVLIALALLCGPAAVAGPVKKVDLLAPLGLTVNAAGPLLVRMDEARQRLVVANTLTSSLTLIDCRDRSLRNVAIGSRVPQYLKAEALAIDGRSGYVHVIGDRALEVVDPELGKARSFATGRQFEMVAVDEATGDAFLVGRESRDLAWVDTRKNRVRFVPWCESEERAKNLNQTPPPPLRKVVCDGAARLVAAVDGYTATLHLFSADGLKPLGKRALALQPGGRWHFAGYSAGEKMIVLVVETAERKVVQAAKVALAGSDDVVVPLPGLSEGVGIRYSEGRDELYIPYDNHPSLHVVDFKDNNALGEIMLPAYGNDATAVDEANGILYVASWAYGEVDQVDLNARRLRQRFFQPAVLPHMFNMDFNGNDGKLYIPLGATAVNGAFGAAITVFDPNSGALEKIRTGWAPQELIRQPDSDAFLAFSSEDQMARIDPDGRFRVVDLPVLYPHRALATPAGNVYLAYGPHQSYWPVVYIWAARNGILGIDGSDFSFYDRRIPRLAQAMALTGEGALYALQNNWGDEKQFLVSLKDEVRAPNQGDMRLELEDTVSRETTQRLLVHDPDRDWLLIGRVGEKDEDPGVLQAVDAKTGKTLRRLQTGLTPTALAVSREHIFVVNFDSDSLSVINKDDFSRRDLACGRQPLKLALVENAAYVINHGGRSLSEFMPGPLGWKQKSHRIPFAASPDQVVAGDGKLLITGHSARELFIIAFDITTKKFTLLHRESYPYGQVSFAGSNSSFFVRGQFGDGVYDLCQVRFDARGRAWVSDFLSGRVFIIDMPTN
jgi:DNA-binding beta-propeller fold protein YncE